MPIRRSLHNFHWLRVHWGILVSTLVILVPLLGLFSFDLTFRSIICFVSIPGETKRTCPTWSLNYLFVGSSVKIRVFGYVFVQHSIFYIKSIRKYLKFPQIHALFLLPHLSYFGSFSKYISDFGPPNQSGLILKMKFFSKFRLSSFS